jgi:hypothetical protein
VSASNATVSGATPAARANGIVVGALAPSQPSEQAQRWDRIAFTFCRMGTTGLIAWLLTPPVFVLLVSVAVVALYGRAFALGALDAVWLFALGQRLPI